MDGHMKIKTSGIVESLMCYIALLLQTKHSNLLKPSHLTTTITDHLLHYWKWSTTATPCPLPSPHQLYDVHCHPHHSRHNQTLHHLSQPFDSPHPPSFIKANSNTKIQLM
ncbi:unnamed protein product [Lactuca virosa]|uniref:Uncharacterized protein n=1 Tax=Lactuca virosa TaxID=75947 RepID=A0AAU9LKE8_9ASTR|nr:unnamed protein product [Lactuca virosa]